MPSPQSLTALLLLCASTARASCAYGTHLHARAEDGAVKVNTFGYTGTISPLNWLSLDPAANAACATGRTQSPIDMTQGQFSLIQAADVQLNLPDIAETEFENLGTTVEVIAPPGGSMVANGTTFNLKQFHFHLPSEHLDQGRSFAMEMHMVFESDAKQIAVLGVYLDTANGAGAAAAPAPAAPAAAEAKPKSKSRRHARDVESLESKRQVQVISGGTPSSSTQSIIDAILAAMGVSGGATTGGSVGNVGNVINVGQGATVGATTGGSSLIDTVMASVGKITTPGSKTKIGPLSMAGLADSLKAGQLQTYSGSLTTPPCSEGVRWFVSTQKQTISLQTFDAARSVIGFNARFPQNKLGQENVLALAVAANNARAAAPRAAP